MGSPLEDAVTHCPGAWLHQQQTLLGQRPAGAVSSNPQEAAKLGSRSPRGTRLPGRGTGSRGGADEGLRLGDAEMSQTCPWEPRASRTSCPQTTFLPHEDVGRGSHAIMSRWSREATLPTPEDTMGPLFGLGGDRLKPNAPRRSPGGR